MRFLWTVRKEIIRTVLCYVVCTTVMHNDTHMSTFTVDSFYVMIVFVSLFRFNILFFFWFSLDWGMVEVGSG